MPRAKVPILFRANRNSLTFQQVETLPKGQQEVLISGNIAIDQSGKSGCILLLANVGVMRAGRFPGLKNCIPLRSYQGRDQAAFEPMT